MRGKLFAIALACSISFAATSFADTVSLIADDGFGETSFNTGLHWSDGLAPMPGNDYVTGDFRVRTPPDGGSYVFGGDSLTVNNTNGYSWGLMYKGTGNAGTITIADLILDGGMISHANGSGDVFNLDGAINVMSDSQIYAKQGPINILAPISGTGTITNPGSDGDGRTLALFSAANMFTGDIVNDGRLALADDAVLNFVIGAAGMNNSVSGGGASAVFDGDFVLDLSGASTNVGDSWTLVSAANASYGATFNIPGFIESGDVWSNGLYSFDEATGVLTVVPEPASLLLLALGGLALIRRR
jgi:hypothetical protein